MLSRLTNLELLQKYGSNAWRIHNFQLEATAKNYDKAVEDLKQLTVEVNRDRKNTQVRRVPSSDKAQILIPSPPDTTRSSTHRPRDEVDRAHLECTANRDG